MKKTLAAVALVSLCLSSDLWACAVCFGDPKSPMVHGALAAVWFLLGVVSFLLCCILGVAIHWYRRARLVEVQNILHGEQISGS
jgi:hypothetical protein